MTEQGRARLPQGDALRVDQAKLVDYLLSSEHLDGASKARFFMQFGFDQTAWPVLQEALQAHGREREVVTTESTPYGIKYGAECALRTPCGRSPCIASIWIAEADAAPRLITAFPVHR